MALISSRFARNCWTIDVQRSYLMQHTSVKALHNRTCTTTTCGRNETHINIDPRKKAIDPLKNAARRPDHRRPPLCKHARQDSTHVMKESLTIPPIYPSCETMQMARTPMLLPSPDYVDCRIRKGELLLAEAIACRNAIHHFFLHHLGRNAVSGALSTDHLQMTRMTEGRSDRTVQPLQRACRHLFLPMELTEPVHNATQI